MKAIEIINNYILVNKFSDDENALQCMACMYNNCKRHRSDFKCMAQYRCYPKYNARRNMPVCGKQEAKDVWQQSTNFKNII